MAYLIKYNKLKLNNIDLIQKILTYFLLSACVILFIADISEASKIAWIRSHSWKWTTLDWMNYWSCWTIQFVGFSSLILIIINIWIDKHKNKTNNNILIIATNLKVFSMTYLLITAGIYTIALITKTTDNTIKSFNSIAEHQITPSVFLVYLIFDFYKIKFSNNLFFFLRKLFLCIILLFIYPAFFILFELINGVATPNSYFGYTQFNFELYGWAYVWKNIFISFAIFLGVSLLVFQFVLQIEKKCINENIKWKIKINQ